MTRVAVLLLIALIGCTRGEQDETRETEQVPIGPGSDSTTLLSPDTPVSRREPRTADTPPAPDTTR